MTVSGSLVADDFLDRGVPDHLDLGVLEQPVLQDALGAQAVAAMDQRHLGGEVGEVERLLDGGVAAADDHDLLAAEEEAVAGGAGRDAEALELLARRQAEPLRLGAGGDDQRIAAYRSRRNRPSSRNGRCARSTLTMWSEIIVVPTCSACGASAPSARGPG